MKKEGFRIDLRDEELDHFYNIKNRNQLKTNVEVFRHALETTDELEQGAGKGQNIHPQFNFVIERLLQRPDVREKFGITNGQEAIKLAVSNLIEEINGFTRERSLVHWDVRKSLQGIHHDIALAFKQVHMDSQDGSVSLNNLCKQVDHPKEKVRSIMNEFVYQSLVTKEEIGERTLYHVF